MTSIQYMFTEETQDMYCLSIHSLVCVGAADAHMSLDTHAFQPGHTILVLRMGEHAAACRRRPRNRIAGRLRAHILGSLESLDSGGLGDCSVWWWTKSTSVRGDRDRDRETEGEASKRVPIFDRGTRSKPTEDQTDSDQGKNGGVTSGAVLFY